MRSELELFQSAADCWLFQTVTQSGSATTVFHLWFILNNRSDPECYLSRSCWMLLTQFVRESLKNNNNLKNHFKKEKIHFGSESSDCLCLQHFALHHRATQSARTGFLSAEIKTLKYYPTNPVWSNLFSSRSTLCMDVWMYARTID